MRSSSTFLLLAIALISSVSAQTKTWDGRHDTSQIDVTVVYFVPADRRPLPDWRERIDYFCNRIEQFHAREFQGTSTLQVIPREEPLVSELDTEQLRRGDANAIFFRTLGEVDKRLAFGEQKGDAFPILLVLSDINWRPLDNFYRLHPEGGQLVFEGNLNQGQHFPGAASGGARATYLSDRGVGWGLVSADGWRVPYRGSDCVVYHEGVGHSIGLPHPEPDDESVMSMGQYHGWISESYIEKNQKSRLGWQPQQVEPSPQVNLFSAFRALPDNHEPKPGETIRLKLDWPANVKASTCRLRYQTAIDGPWIEVPQTWDTAAPATLLLGSFERPTPVSYRVNVETTDGATADLWGYLQVRQDPLTPPQPTDLSTDLIVSTAANAGPSQPIQDWQDNETNVLQKIDLPTNWMNGDWSFDKQNTLLSPKMYGARLQIPMQLPATYRMVYVVEPLDEPNGLILGLRSGDQRFLVLLNYQAGDKPLGAIENIDGQNIGNETTFSANVFRKGRVSQVIVNVRPTGVHVAVDGQAVIDWRGKPTQLSLDDYWATPDATALFVGAYDCRYRFHRISMVSQLSPQ
jgi:hypothetical protein